MSYVPRWYQAEAKAKTFQYFAEYPVAYNELGVIRPRNPVLALPTGTGKSLVIADTAITINRQWPGCRVCMATHVKELIEQNAAEVAFIDPHAPIGIFSAGLKQKFRSELRKPIVFGGIKTLMNAVQDLGVIHVLLIDEAHLLGPDEEATYQKFIAALRILNPFLVIVGYTATPYRTGIGLITNNGIFTDIIYDLTGYEAFNRLVYEGYLSPLYSPKTVAFMDTSNVGIQAGDYNQKQLAEVAGDAQLENDMVKEFLHYAQNRTAGLFFAQGIQHAEDISRIFAWHGVEAPAVHSELSQEENDRRIKALLSGRVRCLVNNNKLTTGFNYRPIDIIGVGRATLSSSLHVQMLGRGTRPSPETYKKNCLVLDYAKNTGRLGPINDPHVPTLKKGAVGDAPIWVCESCTHQNHARAAKCEICGFIHDMTQKLTNVASDEDVMRNNEPVIETYEVDRVLYELHEKPNKPNSIKVSYVCGMVNMFHEWVCLEHPEPVGHRARQWFRKRGLEPKNPETGVNWTSQEALAMTQHLARPTLVRVQTNCQYPDVQGVEF